MSEVALITLHGMGKVDLDYYSKLEDKLKKKLGDDWEKVSFQNVQYAEILQTPEDELWQAMKTSPDNDLDATWLRKFFLYFLGDATALEHSAHRDKVEYIKVQEEIQRALSLAYIDLEESTAKPVVIIAHSLGCQVMSNYLWDAKEGLNIFENTDGIEAEKLKFLKLTALRNFITIGCNIPLFIGGIRERKCFPMPNDEFQWDNYYDPDDILGWPLRQLGSTYEFINDHHINAGRILSGTPLSHTKYWSDSDVIKPLSTILKKFL